MICDKCGKSIPEDAVFCSYCGARRERKVCKACGTELKGEQLFCHVCGLKWEGETSHPEEPGEKAQSAGRQTGYSSEENVGQQTGYPAGQAATPPTTQPVALTEEHLPSDRSRVLSIALCAAYAVLAVLLVITGWFGYYDYYFWSSAYDQMIKHRAFALEQPFFWLCAVAVAAGTAHQIVYLYGLRKGKKAGKVSFMISMGIILLALVFFVLLCYGEGYGIHFMF